MNSRQNFSPYKNKARFKSLVTSVDSSLVWLFKIQRNFSHPRELQVYWGYLCGPSFRLWLKSTIFLDMVIWIMLSRQTRNQEFEMGPVLEAGSNIKRSWPKFWSDFSQSESVFLSKLGDLQNKKRKVFSQTEAQFFWSNSHQVRDHFSSRIPMRRGAIFILTAKISFKSANNRVFCILFSPPPLATLLFLGIHC